MTTKCWNDGMTEQDEVKLIQMFTPIRQSMGADEFHDFVDKMLLNNEAVLLSHATPDNPGLIRLKELIAKRDRGFE